MTLDETAQLRDGAPHPLIAILLPSPGFGVPAARVPAAHWHHSLTEKVPV
jgi:hypothetical protein